MTAIARFVLPVLLGLAACAAPEPRSLPPAGMVDAGPGGAAGFQHTIERSRFVLGTNVRGVDELGFAKLVGTEGAFAVMHSNGAVLATQHARSLEQQKGVSAQALNRVRHERGALEFQTIEVQPLFDGDTLRDLAAQVPNRAKSLIENLMVAANGVTARFLDAHGFPSLRRVVKSPERWDLIRALAEALGEKLPDAADSGALNEFLGRRKEKEPDTFPDLSRTIIQLLGSGEYVVDPPGQEPPGHFGLAVRDYTHSTAPNRRYPDLITQRLVKAALAGHPSPYSISELEGLAVQTTRQEDNANKVERQTRKSAAALTVQSRIGAEFDAFVTGASSKGTWVRVVAPPIEGRLVRGTLADLDVGDRVRVRLSGVNVDRGFIDFDRSESGREEEVRRKTSYFLPAFPALLPRLVATVWPSVSYISPASRILHSAALILSVAAPAHARQEGARGLERRCDLSGGLRRLPRPQRRRAPQTRPSASTSRPPFPISATAPATTPELDVDWKATIRAGRPRPRLLAHHAGVRRAAHRAADRRGHRLPADLCRDRRWPRGELNLPRPLTTEKAFPESETVDHDGVRRASRAGHQQRARLRAAARRSDAIRDVRSRSAAYTTRPARVARGVGDVGLGVKHVLFASTRFDPQRAGRDGHADRQPAKGLGTGVTVFEAFAAYGQILPSRMFFRPSSAPSSRRRPTKRRARCSAARRSARASVRKRASGACGRRCSS